MTPLFLVCGCTPSMSLHGLSSVCAQSERERETSGVSSSSCKDTSPIRLGPHLLDLIYLERFLYRSFV